MPVSIQVQSSLQSTEDLRSHATDLKREIEAKHKWSPKWATHPACPTVKEGPNNTKRPRRRATQACNTNARRYEEKRVGKRHVAGKQDVLNGDPKRCTTIESSTDDDGELSSQTSESPEPEFEDPVTAKGQEVLATALNKAVERYDHQTLIKLVKDEYEVLDGIVEEGHGVKVANSDFDDEFELV